MSTLLTVTAANLRQGIRDKSVIMFGVVVPLALMFVFNLVFGGTDEADFQPIDVSLAAPADDEAAATVRTVLGGLDILEVNFTDAADADLAIVLPDNFNDALTRGEPVTVDVTQSDDAGIEGALVLSVLDQVLQTHHSGAVTAQAALADGLDPSALETLVQRATQDAAPIDVVPGEASDEQLGAGAALVAGQAGLFLLFTVSFGVTSLLIDRETGVLTRIRSMPVALWQVVAAKALTSFITGVVSMTVLLSVGGWLFDASFGALLPVAVLVLAAAAAATSIMFLVVRIARTSEQASIATSIIAIVLGIGGGAFFPVSATGAFAGVLDLNPVAALLRGLGITASGGGLTDIGVPLAIMVGFAVVMVVVSRIVPDRGALT